jgi:hypothetical protein
MGGLREFAGQFNASFVNGEQAEVTPPAIYFFNNACHLWLLRTKLFAIRFTRLKKLPICHPPDFWQYGLGYAACDGMRLGTALKV